MLNTGFSLQLRRVCVSVCSCELVTSLATDELISAVLHQVQDPLVLSEDALPRWVAFSVQVRQVPAKTQV